MVSEAGFHEISGMPRNRPFPCRIVRPGFLNMSCIVHHNKDYYRDKILLCNKKEIHFKFRINKIDLMDQLLNKIESASESASRSESKLRRLHLNHKYRVEGVESSVINKKAQIDYTKLKLAGCTPAIEEIVRKAFRPQKFAAGLCREIGMQCVRGVILHGPPGTGETSTILALCEYFGLEPKVINGPELIDSLVGNSERTLRELFEEAQDDGS
ncbi:unnamed protein product [Adineta steineri]|uniref:Vesicle-fusing ATPase n=1 Tax=Adineta steineri TaxID=433720 RepID=A0A819GR71_9BILA|nr:unnamed protein product [Adineta steineri]CAF3889291.1 unnamed protein product [Adineta steineri]